MSLPIEPYLPAIVAAVRDAASLVLVAEPGAGKTTAVPATLARARPAERIWVLQPRRLAARLAARQVAAAWGTPLGGEVGYRVRFEAAATAATRLVFVTEGMLLRELTRSPRLAGIDGVIFDEFHGRTLAADVGLAALCHLRGSVRPTLWLAVMSATLDVAAVQRLLPAAPVVRVPGRQYPVTIAYQAQRDARPLPQQVAGAVARLRRDGVAGDILTFLAGVAEIEACRRALAGAPGPAAVALHGSLPAAAQDAVVRASGDGRTILATNVAETSVTLPRVVAVIDSGLAREAAYDAHTGMPRLVLQPISQAAAAQRAGRAGRMGPGTCVRLYTRLDAARRPAHAMPEIQRADLAEMVLWLRHVGLPGLDVLPCVEAAPAPALAAAELLLRRLGALTATGALTPLGRAMAALPLHPRLARLLCAARAAGITALGAHACALLAEGAPRFHGPAGTDDLYGRCSAPPPPPLARVVQQMHAVVSAGTRPPPELPPADPEAALARAALAAFPDRVGQCVAAAGGGRELLLCTGRRARLAPGCVALPGGYVVALGAQERVAAGGRALQVDLTQPIAADWLLDADSGLFEARDEVVWDAARGRAERRETMAYGALVLEEARSGAVDPLRAAPLLQAALATHGWQTVVDPAAVAQLGARLALLATLQPAVATPRLDHADILSWLAAATAGCTSIAAARARLAAQPLEATLPGAVQAALARLLPLSIELPHGRRLTVHYAMSAPPHVTAPLQEFFGTAATPRIGGGKLALTVHLLAPNRRPLQVTQDLANFWAVHYPALRPAHARRYPRHAWPLDPLAAAPPAPRRGAPRRGRD